MIPMRIRGTNDTGVPPIAMREIDVNVTNFCNLECIHCSYESTPGKHEPSLDADVVHRLMDQAKAMGNEVMHWSGGEALLHPNIGDFIEHGVELGYGMRLLSNGALLNDAKLDDLWDRGLRKMFVSLDGFEQNHDDHRASDGLFAKTIRGIERSVAHGYDVRVNAVATTRNVDEMTDLLDHVEALGVHTFTVFYLIPVGRGREITDLMVPPDRWRRLTDELRDRASHITRPMQVTVEKVFRWQDEWPAELQKDGRGGGCLGFLDKCDYVNVLSNGDVFPCVCFVDEGPALGNVYDRDLAEILHDPRAWEFYWNMQQVGEACSGCRLLDDCNGGNRPASKVMRGDWFELDPRCSGDPEQQGFMPVCYMLREDVRTRSQSGFAEAVPESP